MISGSGRRRDSLVYSCGSGSFSHLRILRIVLEWLVFSYLISSCSSSSSKYDGTNLIKFSGL